MLGVTLDVQAKQLNTAHQLSNKVRYYLKEKTFNSKFKQLKLHLFLLEMFIEHSNYTIQARLFQLEF
jgi:hypothetical protein